MERSLSALLLVREAQSTLADTVHRLLEVLPELTGDFEVIVVDDGSFDATIEIADELARCFPQIRAVRHSNPRGRLASIRTGLTCSRGEVILFQDEGCDWPLDEIHRLWRAMDCHEIVLARVALPAESTTGRRGHRVDRPGLCRLQMVTRRAVEPLVGLLHDQMTLRSAVAQQGYPWCELELGAGCWPQRAHIDPASSRRSAENERTSGPKRPNYLARLKDFALGE